METLQISTDTILDHHLKAFRNNDLAELMKDYSAESEVWTPDGAVVGLEAIAAFYTYIFSLLPKEQFNLDIKQRIVKEHKAYLVWSTESPFINIPVGTDSFQISGDKIIWQSLAAHIIPK
ncbi:hypothetical protein AAE02nite_28160 [Adhaeribacter aerolatus]|uniref:SnoaL-like domain-containing protein n=1 Tax=Adhaeribacter aerolatus TaxID=670289 RepID=A0A512AZL1_9BACT|nr:nuclear transport factor 2 family protein [Adhaeribacter aerolatus]GEO05152.1 hypothetical protein AAE02nite_28160 [Adhaeribacter aerolatus]